MSIEASFLMSMATRSREEVVCGFSSAVLVLGRSRRHVHGCLDCIYKMVDYSLRI